MNITTIILGGGIVLFLGFIISAILFTIFKNVINGRKFHHQLNQEFSQLRLSKMLSALELSKSDYIYQTKVYDIKQQMNRCSDCIQTNACDEILSTATIDITDIEFCNNEAELKQIKQIQSLS